MGTEAVARNSNPEWRSDKLRLLLIDDHQLFTESLALLLKSQTNEFEVECALSVTHEHLEQARADRFDVILLDLRMPGFTSIEDLAKVWLHRSNARVVIISGFAGPRDVERVVQAGFHGLLPKTMSTRALVNAVRLIAAGERFFPSFQGAGAETRADALALSARERAVLELVCKGAPNKAIGIALQLDESVVKAAVRTVCNKFGVANRTALAIKAIELGLLD
jgi:DNA-binding NarL/FixJ family response regulator